MAAFQVFADLLDNPAWVITVSPSADLSICAQNDACSAAFDGLAGAFEAVALGDRFREVYRRAQQKGRTIREDVVFRAQAETRCWRTSLTPSTDDKGDVNITVIAFEVTDIKRREQKARDRLRAMQSSGLRPVALPSFDD